MTTYDSKLYQCCLRLRQPMQLKLPAVCHNCSKYHRQQKRSTRLMHKISNTLNGSKTNSIKFGHKEDIAAAVCNDSKHSLLCEKYCLKGVNKQTPLVWNYLSEIQRCISWSALCRIICAIKLLLLWQLLLASMQPTNAARTRHIYWNASNPL